MIRFLILFLLILVTKTLSAQTEQTKFIHSLLTTDSSFIGLRLHKKIAPLSQKYFCKSIAYLFDQKNQKMYDKVFFSKIATDTSKKAFDSLLLASGILENQILKEAAKYDSLCYSLNIQNQIKLNNKKKHHLKKHLPKTIRIIPFTNQNSKPHFSISNPIFFENNSKAFIKVYVHYGKLYGHGYIELFEKNKLGKWISVEKVVLFIS